MDDSSPDRVLVNLNTPHSPETPPNARGLPLDLLIPSSLFRPWDTPESLSPTSSNVPPDSLSPSSSQQSPTSSTSSLPSSPVEPSSELSPPQTIYSANGDCLYTIEPLDQGVEMDKDNVKQDNLDFLAGPDKSRKRKRKERFTHSAASPVLAKKRGGMRGEFPACGVCGEESTGVHYGAPVCEGCKGFFRRRVVYRDVSAMVCGSGGQCNVSGKGRIHCKLCRYNRCVMIGMKPGSIKQEVKVNTNMSWEEQVLRCHKETMVSVPAVFLARQHTENMVLAQQWPVSADLGPVSGAVTRGGAGDSVRFIQSLPGWSDLTQQDKQWSLTTGAVQVMVARLLSRYRPEVGAFLFPSGEAVSPSQLHSSLPEVTISHLTSLAHSLASRGLTQQEMSLVCALLSVNPLNASPLYTRTMTAVSDCTSGLHLTDLALQISELSWSASSDQWTNIVLTNNNSETFTDFTSLVNNI